MAKIKQRLKNLRILPTFLLVTIGFILIAMLLAECEKTAIRNAQYEIAFQYSDVVEGFNARKVWGNDFIAFLSENHSNSMQFYEALNWILPPLTYFICILTGGLLFYKVKIQQPIFLLTSAADKISKNELDFSLYYDKSDEMGTLCEAFEKMRSALESNHREMWRQMDDRKKLNAAFSHDLRTPLTVLEGHLGMLQKYVPEGKLSIDDTIDTYKIMTAQVGRLKEYVLSMNTLQRFEDISITVTPVATAKFMQELKDTADIISSEKELLFLNKVKAKSLSIDAEIVMQVYENLLSNAVRYAKKSISVTCCMENNMFSICVMDDGNGFDKASLKSATRPFYTTEKRENSQHFGLGLNICKILCSRHNGDISLGNSINGGAWIIAKFKTE